jgi:hypothetical protein
VFANVCVCECVYKCYTHQELICPQADDDDDAVLCHAKKGTREKMLKIYYHLKMQNGEN